MAKTTPPTLDLHGYKKEDVFDTVDKFIHGCRTKTARINHGKGKGIIKKEVLRYLKLAGYPSKPEKLSNGSKNDGVLIVFID